ncbi:Arylsulfatase A [Spirosomataceae bacterium TFI 002]|nr:Arylsulfatase A [Spirosomataceae bacterium TFI 002]
MKKLLTILPLTLLCFSSCTKTASKTEIKQPNIIWISAEDLSPIMACYGDSTVSTPNLDRLAKEGIVYNHAYTTAGVCSPARNAIITGMYQISTGGHNMRTMGNTYPEQTGLPKSYSSVPPPSVRCFPEYLRKEGYFTGNFHKTDYQFEAPATVWDEIGKERTSYTWPTDKPFFTVFNYTTTHESQLWKRADHEKRADPAKVKLPPYYPDTETARNVVARQYSNMSELDDEIGQLLASLESQNLLENTIIFFWGDHGDGIPFYKREVYKRGLHIPLIIRMPDGENAGTYNDDFISAIDFGPTVLSLAGIPTPKNMHGQAFLGEYKAKKNRDYIFGARDRLDSEYDRVRTVLDKKYQYVRNFYPERPLYMNVAYRKQIPLMVELLEMKDKGQLNKDQMFWFQPTKAPEELYDLEADPYQLNNLINDPSLVAKRKELTEAMDNWLASIEDYGAIPEKELVAKWWNGKDHPPLTEEAKVEIIGEKATISCPTEGASIGYKFKSNTTWNVYNDKAIELKGDSLMVLTHRIGYEPSIKTISLKK